MKRRYGVLLALGLCIGIGIPLLLGGKQAFQLVFSVSPMVVALMLFMIFVGWNLNAGRIRLLAGGNGLHIGQGKGLAMLLATEFAICNTPVGSGGPVVFTWLMSRYGLSKSRSLALYTANQFIDILFFLSSLCVILLYWLLHPRDLHLGWQIGALVALLFALIGLMWLFLGQYRRVFSATSHLLQTLGISYLRRRQIARLALEFHRGLRLVREFSSPRLLSIFILCVGHWLLRYSVLYIAVQAVGGYISWSYAFVVQMLSLTAGQLTLLPGGSGGAEVSASLLLATQVDATTAAAAILLWRFATFHWYLIASTPVFAVIAGRPIWQRVIASS